MFDGQIEILNDNSIPHEFSRINSMSMIRKKISGLDGEMKICINDKLYNCTADLLHYLAENGGNAFDDGYHHAGTLMLLPEEIIGSEFENCTFNGTSFASVEGSLFENCNILLGNFEGETIRCCEFKNVIFKNCQFYDFKFITCKFENVDFDNCEFGNCDFEFCDIPDIGFYNNIDFKIYFYSCDITEMSLFNNAIECFEWSEMFDIYCEVGDIYYDKRYPVAPWDFFDHADSITGTMDVPKYLEDIVDEQKKLYEYSPLTRLDLCDILEGAFCGNKPKE